MRTAAITTALVAITVFIALACGGDGSEPSPPSTAPPSAEATAAPDASSVFPVVLEHDTRVIAKADGSDITEVPVEYRPRTATFGYVSPQGGLTATYREGTVLVQEGNGEPMAIADLPTDAEFATIIWSPDGSRMMVGPSEAGVFVVEADGSGLTEVAADIEGARPMSWSPDNERIAFARSDISGADVRGSLYVAQADGTGRVLAGEFTLPQGHGGWDPPAWSPDGSKIAVLFAPSPEIGIRVMDVSGGPFIDIPVDLSTIKLSWSPDGRFLAFDGGTVGSDVMVVDMTSPEDVRVLTQGYWPRWSPDGSRIAFKRGEFGNSQVYTIAPDGSNLVTLGELGPEDRSDLVWSADGESVEFIRSAPSAQYVYAVELATGEVARSPEPLTDVPYIGPLPDVRLSPDGDEIAFSIQGYQTQKDDDAAGWFLMDILTGELTRVTNDPGAVDIYWSSEGIRIASSAGSGGVYVTDGDGSAPRQVSAVETSSTVRWSPDGRSVAFLAGANIHIVDVETSDETTIPAGSTDESNPPASLEWSPDGTALLHVAHHYDGATGVSTSSTFIADLDGTPPRQLVATGTGGDTAGWSPDGRTIAFSRVEDTGAELWLVEADGGGERRIASFDDRGFGFGPLHWSPDGESIAVLASGQDIYVIDVETGASLLVATNVGNCLMSLLGWSPDSDVIYAIPACALGGL